MWEKCTLQRCRKTAYMLRRPSVTVSVHQYVRVMFISAGNRPRRSLGNECTLAQRNEKTCNNRSRHSDGTIALGFVVARTSSRGARLAAFPGEVEACWCCFSRELGVCEIWVISAVMWPEGTLEKHVCFSVSDEMITTKKRTSKKQALVETRRKSNPLVAF